MRITSSSSCTPILLALALSSCALEEEPALAVTEAPVLANYTRLQTRATLSPGTCLDVQYGANTNGAFVELWGCNDGAAQNWTMLPTGEVKTPYGRCLDVADRQTTDGTPVTIWDCHGGANQKWTIVYDPYNTRAMLKGLGGKCLTSWDGRTAGSGMYIATCGEFPDNQSWWLETRTKIQSTTNPADKWKGIYTGTGQNISWDIGVGPTLPSDYYFQDFVFETDGTIHFDNGGCVDAAITTVYNPYLQFIAEGAKVRILPCTGKFNQKWIYTGGMLKTDYNKCLTKDYDPARGPVLKARACNGRSEQLWSPVPKTII